jgi:hypothetical protein
MTIEEAQKRIAELEKERDTWREMAVRLLPFLPAPPPPPPIAPWPQPFPDPWILPWAPVSPFGPIITWTSASTDA